MRDAYLREITEFMLNQKVFSLCKSSMGTRRWSKNKCMCCKRMQTCGNRRIKAGNSRTSPSCSNARISALQSKEGCRACAGGCGCDVSECTSRVGVGACELPTRSVEYMYSSKDSKWRRKRLAGGALFTALEKHNSRAENNRFAYIQSSTMVSSG